MARSTAAEARVICTACTRSGSAGECTANVRMWMPSAGTAQPVAMVMVAVGVAVRGEVGDAGNTGGEGDADGVGDTGDAGDAGDAGASGDARTSAASGAMSGASVAPAVAQAVIAARSVSVMLE